MNKIISKLLPFTAFVGEVLIVYSLGKEVVEDVRKRRRLKNIRNNKEQQSDNETAELEVITNEQPQ